jgi:hypothetical protein
LAEHDEPTGDEPAEPAEPSEPEAEQPDEPEPAPQTDRAATDEPRADDVLSQIRAIRVGDLLLTTVTTLTSIAYGKLDTGELEEARGAIDAIRALLPILEGRVDHQLRRDLERALANLQVAYADAAARGSN